MKSIFKKIAFVLALAMVVTAFPAKTAAAASEPWLKAKRTLYIGGDATEQYADAAWASVKKGDYSVKFASKDEKIVTVNAKNGRLHAVSVGETVVTATFSKDGAKDIVKECAVKVKQNAGAVELDEKSAEMTVGDKITIKATPENENTTDKIHFAPKADADKEIIDVDYDNGEITAKAEGTATVLVYATQWEYNKDTKKWAKKVTTEKVEFTVTVKEPPIKVQQTASDAFEIVFPNKDAADVAVKNTLPSINKAEAAVTENKEIVKVFQVLQAATDKTDAVETYVFIKDITAKENVVTVTMFNELKEETSYIVRYQGKDATFKTCKNVAAKLTAWNQEVANSRTENSVEVAVRFDIWAVGENGQDVKITNSEAYGTRAWETSVNIEDLATVYDASYVFSGNTVWFYTNDANFKVNLKASFEDWYVVEGSEAKTLTCYPVVTPGNTQVKIGNILQWGIVGLDAGNKYTVQKLAVEDSGRRLAVEASINNYGKDDKVATNKDDLANDGFTFVSSNDDKLSIDKDTGEIYPPKAAVSNVLIHVYYKDAYIGSCPVTVVAKRTFARLTAQGGGNLAYGTNYTDVAYFGITAYDQLGDYFAGVTVDFDVADPAQKDYVDVITSTTTGNGTSWVAIRPTVTAPAIATNVRLVVTATFITDEGNEIVRKSSISYNVKNTNGAAVASYKLEANKGATIDEALYMPADRYDNNASKSVESKTLEVKAFSVDKQGYKIEQLQIGGIENDSFGSGSILTANNTRVLIKKGTTTYTAGKNFSLASDNNGRATVTNGKLVFRAVTTGGAIAQRVENAEIGNYVVSLFVGDALNSKAVYKSNQVLVVKNSQDLPTFKWVKSNVDVVASVSGGAITTGSALAIAKEALELYFDQDRDGVLRNWPGGNDIVTNDIISADVSLVGNKATIKSVTYVWKVKDYSGVAEPNALNQYELEFVIPINRTVTTAN